MTLSYQTKGNGHSLESPFVVIADSCRLQRSCLAWVLRAEFEDCAVLEIESTDRLESVVGKHVSLAVLNIGNAAMMDACVLQNLSNFRRQMPEVPFMLLTQQHESATTDVMISELSRLGVRGCIPGSAAVEITLAALRLVIAGGTYFPRSVVMDSDASPNLPLVSTERIAVTQAPDPLNGASSHASNSNQRIGVAFTERERQVVATLQRGLSNKIIAYELRLSENTVKTHISRIMRKLEVTNRTEAALAVQRTLTSGLLSLLLTVG